MRRRDFLQAARGALSAAAIPSAALVQFGCAMPSFDQTPDKPQSFGHKVSWFAVKVSNTASVLDALEFGGQRQPTGRPALQVRRHMKVRREAILGFSCRHRSVAGSLL